MSVAPLNKFLYTNPQMMMMLDVIPWDAVRYCDRLSIHENGRNETREEVLLNAYPPPSAESDKILDAPGIIIDMHGVILAWYLPEVLPAERQVCLPGPIQF
jgi:hypothetical protein